MPVPPDDVAADAACGIADEVLAEVDVDVVVLVEGLAACEESPVAQLCKFAKSRSSGFDAFSMASTSLTWTVV